MFSNNPFRKHRANNEVLNESKFLIPEEIPANERTAFHGAAAGAAKDGKTSFSFAGKKYPVTMNKGIANNIADQKEEKVNEDPAHYAAIARANDSNRDHLQFYLLILFDLQLLLQYLFS